MANDSTTFLEQLNSAHEKSKETNNDDDEKSVKASNVTKNLRTKQ